MKEKINISSNMDNAEIIEIYEKMLDLFYNQKGLVITELEAINYEDCLNFSITIEPIEHGE